MQHPDYPYIEFKPQIAQYDWHQTYDVLKFERFPEGFLDDEAGIWAQAGIPCFENLAVDRYTPDNYLWAEAYSDKLYYLLKDYVFSPFSSIVKRELEDEVGYPNIFLNSHSGWKGEWQLVEYQQGDVVVASPYFRGQKYWYLTNLNAYGLPDSAYGWREITDGTTDDLNELKAFYYVRINGEYWLTLVDSPTGYPDTHPGLWIKISISIPQFEFTGGRWTVSTTIPATFEPGKYRVTGLVYDGQQQGLNGSIHTLNQVFTRLNFSEPTQFDLSELIKGWIKDEDLESNPTQVNDFASNSVVITKITDESETVYTPAFTNKPNWLLYEDIDRHFNQLKSELDAYFNAYQDYWLHEGIYSFNCLAPQTHPQYQTMITFEYGNALKVTPLDIGVTLFPQEYRELAFLQRANNWWTKADNLTEDDLLPDWSQPFEISFPPRPTSVYSTPRINEYRNIVDNFMIFHNGKKRSSQFYRGLVAEEWYAINNIYAGGNIPDYPVGQGSNHYIWDKPILYFACKVYEFEDDSSTYTNVPYPRGTDNGFKYVEVPYGELSDGDFKWWSVREVVKFMRFDPYPFPFFKGCTITYPQLLNHNDQDLIDQVLVDEPEFDPYYLYTLDKWIKNYLLEMQIDVEFGKDEPEPRELSRTQIAHEFSVIYVVNEFGYGQSSNYTGTGMPEYPFSGQSTLTYYFYPFSEIDRLKTDQEYLTELQQLKQQKEAQNG